MKKLKYRYLFQKSALEVLSANLSVKVRKERRNSKQRVSERRKSGAGTLFKYYSSEGGQGHSESQKGKVRRLDFWCL